MLDKLIIIYYVIVSLNSANKLYTRALNFNDQNDKGLKTIGAGLISSDNIETWQPIIQKRNWLTPLNISTSATPSTPLMSTMSTPSVISSSSRIKLTQKQHQQQQNLKPYQQKTDYIPYNHRGGNNSKFNTTTTTTSQLTASDSPSKATTAAFTNIKFKPSYLLMLNTNKQLRHNPTQHQPYLAQHTENVYPKIPNDIISQVQQPYMNTITSKFPHNLHNPKADVNLHIHQPPPPPQQHYANTNIITTPPLDTFQVQPTHPTGTIFTKNLNSFKSEKNLIDLNFTNQPAKNSQRAEYDDVAHDVVNLNEKLLLLQKTFDNVLEFYDNVKDIILLSDKNNADDTHSNEDKIDDGNDLTKVNSALGSDAAVAATEKLSSLNMKKTIPLSSTLIGKVQGYKRQHDKGTAMKYTLISSQQQSEAQQNVLAKVARPADTTARGLMWNMSKAKSSLASAALASSLSTLGTGRKIKKKLKKKFQKFLFPLVLAYKLKFLALIPLLIGGLTLLVGATGLAGFFFALFTAVMSLKSGAKSAIVVKKY